MKWFKKFNLFTRDLIIKYKCLKYRIKNYSINDDGSIDVNGNVRFPINRKMRKLPLRFKNVSHSFYCNNLGLKTLEGCPEKVFGVFSCAENNLTSLKGCPKTVGSFFECYNNDIYSFEGISESYFYFLNCDGNPIDEIYALCPTKDFIEMIEEYQAINEYKIIEIRLRQALEDSGGLVPEEFRFENYSLI